LAKLKTANLDPGHESLPDVVRVVQQIRAHWPKVRIVLRGDSGFCREDLMCWCEENEVLYVFGIARNSRLLKRIFKELKKARKRYFEQKKPQRIFKDFTYRTLKSWSRRRRVVGKAEYLAKGANPRFVVTNLPPHRAGAKRLYEKLYCARGDMENRIKEQQLGLFADRTSAATMRANQLRLYFASFAYVLLHGLRRLGLKGGSLARAQCTTIRLKLLQVGARLKITVRKVWLSLSESYPYAKVFAQILANLRRHPLWESSG